MKDINVKKCRETHKLRFFHLRQHKIRTFLYIYLKIGLSWSEVYHPICFPLNYVDLDNITSCHSTTTLQDSVRDSLPDMQQSLTYYQRAYKQLPLLA